MNGFPLIFLHPLVLTGLAALPVLWLILRVLPPLPKNIFLPTARFLAGLTTNRHVPDSAPWWLLLLRLALLACLILAFAAPVFHPQANVTGKGPLNLVFDNGWASAQVWTEETARAENILEAARLGNRPVHLQFTASENASGLMRADQALSRLRSAEPQSWPGDLAALKNDEKAETLWVSSGIADAGFARAAENFAYDGLTVYLPDMKDRPGLMHGPDKDNEKSMLKIETAAGGGDRNVTAQAYDARGVILGQIHQTVTGQTGGEEVIDNFGLAEKKIANWKVTGFAGAGGIYLNDTARGANLIGIVSGAASSRQDNFSNAEFYLTRATEGFAKTEKGTIASLTAKNIPVIILPDIANFSPADMSSLQTFLNRGGVLVRFGGRNMSEADNVLVPVPLKTGLRSLSGDMTWTTPLKLADFPKTGPFAGQAAPDITVERQILAEPSADLDSHVWAKLSDGTPFITARNQGRGLLVLVHSTATPEWSDFVLSGFYLKFLKEILELSTLPDKSQNGDTLLQPSLILNGWGQLVSPSGEFRGVTRQQLETLQPDRLHPPGYYGGNGKKIPFNIGDRIESLDLIDRLPAIAKSETLITQSKERKLSALFFTLAALLFLLDWLLLIALPRWRGFSLAAALFIMMAVSPAQAESDIDRAGLIHLACIHGSADKTCLTALDRVADTLKSRTSTEIGESVIVDPGKDDLSFYPLVYWPVDTDSPVSPRAKTALSAYLSHGGMMLIDTRDGAYVGSQVVPSPSGVYLREQLQGIDIPSLKPAGKNHVLFKSFYLLNLYSDYDLTGKIWVDADSVPPEENLSFIMITGEDWLSKWAYPGNERDAEMAQRFGVNLVLYALTGNYKSDQVHMKAILQRMGQ